MWRFNRNFKKLREYFLCAKKTKKNSFIQQFVSSASPYSTTLDSITYINNICTQIHCLHSDQSVNNMYPCTVLLTQNSIRCLHFWVNYPFKVFANMTVYLTAKTKDSWFGGCLATLLLYPMYLTMYPMYLTKKSNAVRLVFSDLKNTFGLIRA